MEISRLLQKATMNLAAYLEKILPSLSIDWWNESVINSLTFQQRRRVNEQGINSLNSLDLAALLRVLGYNWKRISEKLNLEREAYNFVKEMQTVRNRWAHVNSEGFPINDIYRDLDTLQRFLMIIAADRSLLQEVQIAMQDTMNRLAKDVSFNNSSEKNDQTVDRDIKPPAKPFKTSPENFSKISRIKLWANRPHQDNHKIIMAYLELEKKGDVYLDDLKERCSDRDSKYYVKKFDGHYASMKTDAGNSHGKVFYDRNEIVSIWQRVREEIRKHFGR